MLSSSGSGLRRTIPIVCKIILAINIICFVSELVFKSVVGSYCLSPSRIIAAPSQYYPSLFLSNFFHSNPIQSGPIGIFHILLNMMALINIGSFLEKECGSITFGAMSMVFAAIVGPLQVPLAYILNTLSMNKIGLFSPHQCGIGFSGILFAYFMVYTKLIPNEEMSVFGIKCRKWMIPFVQLVLLSLLLRASFIGHLSGIVAGYLYIAGVPGFFARRHSFIKYVENSNIMQCITNRSGYYASPQQPLINAFNFTPCSSGRSGITSTTGLHVSYSRVSPRETSNKPMTCVNGVLLPKTNVPSPSTEAI